MTQFAFLEAEFGEVFVHAAKAETQALTDPRSACFYARIALETAIKWMYEADSSLRYPYDKTLAALIFEPSFRDLAGGKILTKAKIIKDFGNRAVHDSRKVSEKAATTAVRELFHFSYWLTRTYGKTAKPEPGLNFDPSKLERTLTITESTVKQIKGLREEADKNAGDLETERNARLKSEEGRAALEEELERLRDEIASVRKANEKAPDTHDYSEAETRDAFIDLLLHEVGWPLDQERDREYEVHGMPSDSGIGYVDYVLWGKDGKPLAVIEAKRTQRDARVGQQQAKLYADCLEKESGQRPIIFYTNGYEHWLWDDENYPPRAVQGFLKKQELELLIQRRETRKVLGAVSIDEETVERYYQHRAIRRVGEAFEKDKLRKALLVMATGSGKTRTVIALADQLMRANWVKRTLFLADRIALVDQAARAFKTHMPHSPPINLLNDKESEGRVFMSTYPTMMGLIDEMKNGVRRFGPGHFDLIVIDEAHRSVYRKYRAIFDYFDCLLIGLTATPRDEIDRDTYSLFELERGVPTDAYDLEQAVEDGFLVPPQAISVPLKFQREGIHYDELTEEEKEDWDALEWSEEGETPDYVSPAELNKFLFNEDTVDKVLRHVMTQGHKVAEGDRLGKTIFFAKNHKHAMFIQERFDVNYPHLKGHFARVIDFKTEYVKSLIDDFSERDKAPHIAISVDMLDTGIDVPEVVNLVFFKVVRSKTKFWQMIGRGTRLCEDLFGPGEDKQDFRVFDFCQNFEFFNENPDITDGSTGRSLSERLFEARVELLSGLQGGESGLAEEPEGFEAKDGSKEVKTNEDLLSALETRLFDEVRGMNLENFVIRPRRQYVEKFQDRIAWKSLDQAAQDELVDFVAGLPTALKDDDIAAKQFDFLILRAQLSLLRADTKLAKAQEKICKMAGQLEALSNIPLVAAQMKLILECQSEIYWENITLPMLEELRRKLRGLVQLIDPKGRKIVYSDFEDQIGEGEEIILPTVPSGTNKAQFLKKVRHFLKENEHHITILKLHRNEQLTPQDLRELEAIFMSEAIATEEDLTRVKAEGGLGLFVRSMVGLDREAAKRALGVFLEGENHTPNQIEFINLVIVYLTERGTMDPRQLYESPFTDLDDMGVSGVFESAEVREIVRVLKEIKETAAA